MINAADLERHLATTDEELRVFIDPAHMSYLPVYLGRADARHALGVANDPAAFATGPLPVAVLRELWQAAQVYQAHGGVFLAKWPHTQVRRRRLEPLEVALAAGDPEVLKGVVKVFGVDPLTIFAGIEPDEVTAELTAVTSYFRTEHVADPVELAGTLAIFYWLMLVSLGGEDVEGFEASRRRAQRLIDDRGHLLGGVAHGGIARIKAVHDAFAALKPARPEAYALALVRHRALFDLERDKTWKSDDEARSQGRGALDRTALALLVVAKAFSLDLGGPLREAGADPATLGYARALGHS
jgi:hypothetical protein